MNVFTLFFSLLVERRTRDLSDGCLIAFPSTYTAERGERDRWGTGRRERETGGVQGGERGERERQVGYREERGERERETGGVQGGERGERERQVGYRGERETGGVQGGERGERETGGVQGGERGRNNERRCLALLVAHQVINVQSSFVDHPVGTEYAHLVVAKVFSQITNNLHVHIKSYVSVNKDISAKYYVLE